MHGTALVRASEWAAVLGCMISKPGHYVRYEILKSEGERGQWTCRNNATALIPAALHSDCRVFPRSVNFFERENRPATHSIDVFDHSNRVVLETPVKLILGFSASCRRCIDGFKRSNDHFRCDQGLTVVGNRFRWNSDERPLIMLCDMVSPSNFGDGDCTTSLQLTAIKLLKRDHGVIEPKFLVLDNAPAVYIEAERYRRVVESIARRLISEAPNIKGRALAKRFADISQDVASGDVEPYVLHFN